MYDLLFYVLRAEQINTCLAGFCSIQGCVRIVVRYLSFLTTQTMREGMGGWREMA